MTCASAQPASDSLQACGVTPLAGGKIEAVGRAVTGDALMHTARMQLQAEPLLYEGS